jgi:hypothetical protein
MPSRCKSESSAGNLENPQNFQISCRFFVFPAEDSVFSLEIFFSRRFSNFRAEFFNFRRNISSSAGDLDFLLENLFWSGFFKFPADFPDFQRSFGFVAGKSIFREIS